MIKTKKEQVVSIFGVVGIMLILSILLGICAIVLTVVPCDFNLIKIMLEDHLIFFLNALPIFFTLLIFYFLCNAVWVSFLITGIFVFVIAEVNRFKMIFRDDPFVFEDILLISEAKDMMGKYPLYLDKPSICAILVIFVLTSMCMLFRKIKLRARFVRVLGVVFVGLLALISYNKLYVNNQEIHNQIWHYQFGNQWKGGNQYMARGVVYSFVHSIPNAINNPPDGYNAKDAANIIDNYGMIPLDADKKVHIISVMLEAYNDFSVYDVIEFKEDPYYNFHKIQEEAYHGKLYTDIFAAGTIKTERSFLTGYSDVKISKKATQSYVRYFKEQGYYTEAMHPCYGWFYDRRNVNEQLGFERFYYYENKFAKIEDKDMQREPYHGYLSDYDFVDYIIDGYENTIKNNKMYFNFSVTYQNHGPYSTEKEVDIEYAQRQAGYTEIEYNILNNYLHGVSKTDEALGKLCDYIKEREEPIVLILFGDHNPWLGENNSVYEMLGINLNLDTPDGAANYYQTPYLIYANTSAQQNLQREFKGHGDTISPMFLMGEFFDYVGNDGPAYMNYLQTVRDTYSVLNPTYVCKKGQYILRSHNKDLAILEEQKKVEYYIKQNKVKQ